ncbi:hypothetical protein HCN51_50060 [Nonomuraea sp. FMUSA5-5]|uniref:Uncharacterized protein n=1 Tax=Nonomuraea composti TaxID=2720023 RepID=A0ABX1BRV5_9ACTN|nr:hypothetical protein [Nonomuraea sp. FMUSA5-5]NJP97483.1 hypothetical protein [Nonomuraea sp. FMUSA5-5]
MFKKRLAVLGAVAVLTVTGLGGAALADDHAPTAGTKVTCTTPDGTTVENPPALPEGAEIGFKQGVVVSQDGKVTRLGSNETGQPQSGLPGKPNLTTPSDTPDVTILPDGSEQAAPSGEPNLTAPSGTPDVTILPDGSEQTAPSGEPNLTAPSGEPNLTGPSGEPNLTAPSGNGTDEPANVICIKSAE